MRAYKDATASTAVKRTFKEWKRMAQLALWIREGNGNIEDEEKFTGIFKRLLDDPIDEVRKAAGRNETFS